MKKSNETKTSSYASGGYVEPGYSPERTINYTGEQVFTHKHIELIKEKDGLIKDLKIAYGVAGPTPLRAIDAENYAKNKELSEETLENIGKECLKASKARDSWRASKAFREQLMEELPKRAIKMALGGKL